MKRSTSGRRLAAVTALAAAALAPAGPSPATGILGVDVPVDVPFVSENVSLLGTLPLPGSVGATFRGNLMFATGHGGLFTYDISDPAAPVLLSTLAVPNAFNEDVSIGGDTLLIAHDYGYNSVTVVDISDPAAPVERRTFPTYDVAHTTSCIGDCSYAWMAGGDAITVLDIVNGTEVKKVAPETGWTHDVSFDADGTAWVTGDRGTAAYDVADPLNPRLLANTNAQGAVPPYNDFIHHNTQRPVDPATGRPGDLLLITEEDWVQPLCENDGSFQTWRITGPLSAEAPAAIVPLDLWVADQGTLPAAEEKQVTALCSAHYFDERGGLATIGWYAQGMRVLDVRDPSDIRQVGYFVPPATDEFASLSSYWAPTDPTGEIVYSFDHTRGIDVLRVDRDAAMSSSAAVTAPAIAAAPQPSTASASRLGLQAHPTFGWGCAIPATAVRP